MNILFNKSAFLQPHVTSADVSQEQFIQNSSVRSFQCTLPQFGLTDKMLIIVQCFDTIKHSRVNAQVTKA